MAKGQLRGTREKKKPKKDKAAVAPKSGAAFAGVFERAAQAKSPKPGKK